MDNLREAKPVECCHCGSTEDLYKVRYAINDDIVCRECLDELIADAENQGLDERCQRNDDFNPTKRVL